MVITLGSPSQGSLIYMPADLKSVLVAEFASIFVSSVIKRVVRRERVWAFSAEILRKEMDAILQQLRTRLLPA